MQSPSSDMALYVHTHVCISLGDRLCQLSGFSVVAVIVALFVPTVCPVWGGAGMWGIFGKPMKWAMWNTPVCMLY